MDYQSLHSKTVVELKAIAKDMGVHAPSKANKIALIHLLLDAESAAAAAGAVPKAKNADAAAEAAPAVKNADAAAGAAPAASTEAAPKAAPKAQKASGTDVINDVPAIPKAAPKARKATGKDAPAPAGPETPADKAASKPAKSRKESEEAAPSEEKNAKAPVRGESSAKAEAAPEPAVDAEKPAAGAEKTVAGPEKGVEIQAPNADAGRAAADSNAEALSAQKTAEKPAPRAAGPVKASDQAFSRPVQNRGNAEGARPRTAVAARGEGAPTAGREPARPSMPRQAAPSTPGAARGLRQNTGGMPVRGENAQMRPARPEGAALPANGRLQGRTTRVENSAVPPRSAGGQTRVPRNENAATAPRSDAFQPRFARNEANSPYARGDGVQGRSARFEDGRGDAFQPRYESGGAPLEGQAGIQRPENGGIAPAAEANRPRMGWPIHRPEALETEPAPAGTLPVDANPRPVRPETFERRSEGDFRAANPAPQEPMAFAELGYGAGVLEIQQDGYGFLRAENCLPGPNDVYISVAQIRRFSLRQGDYVEGRTRPQREGDRYSALMYIEKVNGASPEQVISRPRFEDLVPIYPDERLRLEPDTGANDLSLRLIDMLAPIGKGQRGMIVSQPKAGKTTLLKKVANAITARYPDIHLIVLLIDERPEEVTDMQRSIQGEVIYSTFDEEPEHHARVSEMVLERAQRLVETGRDVVVLMDSITRLARAYNLVITPTGRSLSGGLDPGALFRPKRFFGAARNIENGGSLTIIATALVETGSRMDDIIYEEFKGTGNMELHLDRKLSDRRVFPAIDMVRSGTRREELLLSEAEMEGELQVRRMLSGGRQQEMSEELINMMARTPNNAEFFKRLKGWMAVYEKEGYSSGR